MARSTSDPSGRNARKPVSLEILASIVQAADFCAILLACQIAMWAYIDAPGSSVGEDERYWLSAFLAGTILVFLLRNTGTYAERHLGNFRWQIGRVAAGWLSTVLLLAAMAFVTKVAETYSRGWALIWVTMAFAELGVSRVVVGFLLQRWVREGRLAQRVAIVGDGDIGRSVIAKLNASGRQRVMVVGIFDDELLRLTDLQDGPLASDASDNLTLLAQRITIDEVIVALPLSDAARIGNVVAKLRSLPVDLRLCIDHLASEFPVRAISETATVRVVEIFDRPLKHWSGFAKSVEDKILGAICLALFAVPMALIALAIRLDSKGPVLFVQDRFGFNNKVVRVYKFRTMHVEAQDRSGAQRTVPDDPRVTRVGYVLRTLSFDELPQLFNVLRGEMSLVGPRPHAVAMRAGDELYHNAVAEYFQRHRVRPGITGWAQVNGLRGEIDTLEKAHRRVAYDLYYIDHWSLWLDIKILFMTIKILFTRQNAY
jgi:Undecaprenyl-phosphate glucose phosphotransferase